MKRRDLFSYAGYSLAVLLPSASAQSVNVTDRMRRDVDLIAPPQPKSRPLSGEPNMTLVDLETDVFVAGGGLAGVCAAVAAARNGAKVVLVQDRSRLGGNSSSEVKMHVVGADSHRHRPGWRESGLIEEFRLEDAVNNPQRCWEMWDLLLYDKVVSEPNITLLLETILYSAETKSNKIERVMARCDKSEHLYRIKAKTYVDASGDSRLGLESGAEFRTGRETRSEFGESIAPEKADKETLGSSILFTSRIYRKSMPFKAPSWARKVTKEHLKFRSVGPTNWEYGYWWIEWGGSKDTIRDNELIRFELLSIVMGVWDYIKNSGEHTDSANYALDWVGMMPGKRGSRRLVGDHILKEQDLLGTKFPDAVAIGGWPMDDHPPGGFDRSDLQPNTNLRQPEVYDIPLRSLYSKNISNLMMAGRNISATHAAFTSTRVMATCATIGQAVGNAAAMCAERGITPRQLANEPKLVTSLQQGLLRDDQTIKATRNEDSRDLARKAKVSASSDKAPAVARNVVDGFLRDIPGKDGKPVEFHHWSAPIAENPWLELKWDAPQRITRVQLTFDTGFERQLTLSSSNSTDRTVLRMPQPETVKDYTLEYRLKGGSEWKVLATVAGNYQRVNRHRFEAVEAEAIRLKVSAANGIDQARIFEVRCYA